MQSKQELHIPITIEGITAVDCLAQVSGLSKQKIKLCMQKGCVWLERLKTQTDQGSENTKTTHGVYIQRLRRAKKRLSTNEIVHLYYDEKVLKSETKEAVLVKDYGDYSIWNKPSGMLSQGSKWGDHCTIYRWVEKHLKPERPAFIVHRLDRAAEGLILLAHRKNVASQFSKMFENREIIKRYQASVEGDFSKLLSANGMLEIDDDVDDNHALSYVKMLEFDEAENTSLLEVQIETGRKHQIRKHLSGIGFPIVGDRLYGSDHSVDGIDLQLQAKCLEFICPITSETRRFTLGS